MQYLRDNSLSYGCIEILLRKKPPEGDLQLNEQNKKVEDELHLDRVTKTKLVHTISVSRRRRGRPTGRELDLKPSRSARLPAVDDTEHTRAARLRSDREVTALERTDIADNGGRAAADAAPRAVVLDGDIGLATAGLGTTDGTRHTGSTGDKVALVIDGAEATEELTTEGGHPLHHDRRRRRAGRAAGAGRPMRTGGRRDRRRQIGSLRSLSRRRRCHEGTGSSTNGQDGQMAGKIVGNEHDLLL